MQLGLGHILFITYKSIPTLKSIPYRWNFYLASWSIDEFYVSPPLLDFECLSNGYLWFNQFMKKTNGYSFDHYFTPNKIASTLALSYFKCCREINISKLHPN
jgi:hypothetical protein